MLTAVAFLAVGGLAGFLLARAAAPSLGDQVRAAQEQGRSVASGLRVLSLHDEAHAISVSPSGDASVDFALGRTEEGLRAALAGAPWIAPDVRARLTRDVDNLRRTRTEPDFGPRADAVATEIEQALGIPKDQGAGG